MANLKQFQTYDEQTADLQRRQRMAQMLQEQAMAPLESQVAPGGMVVPTSPLLGLSKMLQAYIGGKAQKGVDAQRGELSQRSTAEAQDFLRSLAPGAQRAMTPDAALAASLSAAPTEAQQMTSADRTSAIMQGAVSSNPRMQMAAQLAASMKPEAEEYGTTPVQGADGKYYLVSKSGKFKQTDVSAPAPKPDSPSSAIEEYNFAVKQGFKGSFTEYKQQIARAGATNVTSNYGTPQQGVDAQGNPVFFQTDKAGNVHVVPNVKPEAKPLNEGQANAAGFAKRLEMANEVINASPFEPTIGNQLKAAIPFSNAFLSDAQQQSEQAQREFITAQLRRESGASSSPGEFDTARKQYFPQPGDSKATLEQKAKSRALAIQNMRGAAGPSSKAAAPAWLPGVQSALDKYAPQGGQ
jgi:hypothetical protein